MTGNKKHVYSIYYDGIEDGVEIGLCVGSETGISEDDALAKFRNDFVGYYTKINRVEIYK